MTALELTQPVQPADPSPLDPDTVFIHPPFTSFPDADHHPEGLSYNLMAANLEWFLDPQDFVSSVSSRSDAVQYPVRLEPPRKKSIMALGVHEQGETDEPRFRCTFCRKSYSGENGKSMWRRHVTKRHNVVLSSRREVKKGSRGRHASTVRMDDDNFSDASLGKGGTSVDDALDEQTPENSASPEYAIPSQDASAHRYVQGASTLEISSPLPVPIPVPMPIPLPHQFNTSFNRTASTFVGVAIRQMAEQAYVDEDDSDDASDGDAETGQQYISSSAFRLRRVDPSWSSATS
jgi:hypothetical protein